MNMAEKNRHTALLVMDVQGATLRMLADITRPHPAHSQGHSNGQSE